MPNRVEKFQRQDLWAGSDCCSGPGQRLEFDQVHFQGWVRPFPNGHVKPLTRPWSRPGQHFLRAGSESRAGSATSIPTKSNLRAGSATTPCPMRAGGLHTKPCVCWAERALGALLHPKFPPFQPLFCPSTYAHAQLGKQRSEDI